MKDFRFATFALTGDVRRDAPTLDDRVRVALAPRVRVRCAVNPGRDYAGEKEDVRFATFALTGDVRRDAPTLDDRVRVAVAPRVRVRCAVNPVRDYAGEKEDVRFATFARRATLDKIKIEKYGKDNEPND